MLLLLLGCLELVSLRVVHLLDLLRRSIMAALRGNVHLCLLMVGRWEVRVHDRASIDDELWRGISQFALLNVHGLRELLHLEDTLLVGLDALLEGSERVGGVPYLLLQNKGLNQRLRLSYDLCLVRLRVMVNIRYGRSNVSWGRRGLLEGTL
jgi:hypothetical protein